MNFLKYQHVENLASPEVEGLLDGTVYVFPKLDGANASVWLEDNRIQVGSRNRQIGDGEGGSWGKLRDYARLCSQIPDLMHNCPTIRLYGEWLVPHTLRTYKDEAWEKFYVFDVMREDGSYMHYDEYSRLLDKYGVLYIPVIATTTQPNRETLEALVQENTYLVKEGIGEGIVLKNYDFVNGRGNVVWGKVVHRRFKQDNAKLFGPPPAPMDIEARIVRDFVTPELVEKEYQKIVHDKSGWSSQYIQMLLGRVFYTLITEEMWAILKAIKPAPVIAFGKLRKLTTDKVKEVKAELFGG
jgi:hypothetical protein